MGAPLTDEEINAFDALLAGYRNDTQLPDINTIGEIMQGGMQYTTLDTNHHLVNDLDPSSGSEIGIDYNPQGNHQLAVEPSSSSSSSLGPIMGDRTYNRFSPQDIEKLIEGVEKYSNGRRTNWKLIKLRCFKDSARTKDQLKEKWRHMMWRADAERDPTLKELYLRAKNVDARLRQYPPN